MAKSAIDVNANGHVRMGKRERKRDWALYLDFTGLSTLIFNKHVEREIDGNSKKLELRRRLTIWDGGHHRILESFYKEI